MLEVVSLFILSLFFSFNALEIFSLGETQTAYYFTVATNQLQSMRERLLALNNHDGLSQEIHKWNLENQELLPSGQGQISGRFPMYSATIFWGKKIESCQRDHIGHSGCLHETFLL